MTLVGVAKVLVVWECPATRIRSNGYAASW